MTSKFQQRHYEAIADVIWHILPEITRYGESRDRPLISRNLLIDDLCIMFQKDNPNFNEGIFRRACDKGIASLSQRTKPQTLNTQDGVVMAVRTK